jgi:hypothetical protein
MKRDRQDESNGQTVTKQCDLRIAHCQTSRNDTIQPQLEDQGKHLHVLFRSLAPCCLPLDRALAISECHHGDSDHAGCSPLKAVGDGQVLLRQMLPTKCFVAGNACRAAGSSNQRLCVAASCRSAVSCALNRPREVRCGRIAAVYRGKGGTKSEERSRRSLAERNWRPPGKVRA